MSLPKEPRQLMINLMYLVLTALLALNVSAEVMSAFSRLDESMVFSNRQNIKTMEASVGGLRSLLASDGKEKFRPIMPAVDSIQEAISLLCKSINNTKETLIDAGGNHNGVVDEGDYIENNKGERKLKGERNKDHATRYLVIEGRGEEIELQAKATAELVESIFSNLLFKHGKDFGIAEDEVAQRIQSLKTQNTLSFSDKWNKDNNVSWAKHSFNQMPLAAVLPLLTKISSDARNVESFLLGQLMELSGGRVIEFNKFFPVIRPKQSYVMKGDPFEAELSIGTYSDQIDPNNIKLKVNGKLLRADQNGKVYFKESTNRIGQNKLDLECVVMNPLTSEFVKGTSSFVYEVGERSIALSPTQMNVLYIGVDNPLSLSVSGIPTSDIKIKGEGAGIELKALDDKKQQFNAMVTRVEDCTITVSGGDMPATKFEFRVKKIPDPVARMGKQSEGTMASGAFRAQEGIIAWLDRFDFNAKCTIASFQLTRVPKYKEPINARNSGPVFQNQVANLVLAAKPGDLYYFNDIKAKCPGDTKGRSINSMIFNIR